MRFLQTLQLASFMLPIFPTFTLVSAVDDGVVESLPSTELVRSLAETGSSTSGLRGRDTKDVSSLDKYANVSLTLLELPKPVGELSLEERVSALDDLLEQFDKATALLVEVRADADGSSGMENNQLLDLMDASIEQAKATKKPAWEVVEHVRRALMNTQGKEDADASIQDTTDRAKGSSIDMEVTASGKTSRGSSRQSEETANTYAHHWKKAKRSFKPPKGSQRHAQFHRIHDALTTGDHALMKHTLRSITERHNRRFSAANTNDHGVSHRRRLTKEEQCTQLVECASAMSLYDLLVFYHSDDIDVTTGKVDTNVFSFIEDDILGMQTKVAAAIQDISSFESSGNGAGKDHACNKLLKLFHRTVEHSDVLEWEGATVSQVCLAEGTTTYVKLEEAASSIGRIKDTAPLLKDFTDFYNNNSQPWVDMNFTVDSEQDNADSVHVGSDGTVLAVRGHKIYSYGQDGKWEDFFDTFILFGPDQTGHLTNWVNALDLCLFHNAQLATQDDWCSHGVYGGTKDGNQWAPIGDYSNGWIQVGQDTAEADHTCLAHHQAYGFHPPWGLDTTKQPWENNYVLCKVNTHTLSVGDAENICAGGNPSILRYDHDTRKFQKPVFGPSGPMKQFSCSSAGNVWGINWNGHLFNGTLDGASSWDSRGSANTVGNVWDRVELSTREVWGLAQDGIHRGNYSDGSYQNLDLIPSGSNLWYISAADDGTVFGLIGESVFEFDRSQQKWLHDVAGIPMKSISVGSRGNIWGVDANKRVVRHRTSVNSHAVNMVIKIKAIVEALIVEVIDCGFAIFDHSGQGNVEEFVFTTDNKNVNQERSNIRIPTAFDISVTSGARDVHGMIIDTSIPAFEFKSYHRVMEDFDYCEQKLRVELMDLEATLKKDEPLIDDAEEALEDAEEAFMKALDEYLEGVEKECIPILRAFDVGLGLVFGEKPSPGYICGIKEALIEQGKEFPGRCCLDPPYLLEGDDWGHEYECTSDCKSVGPLFSGMSAQACEAHGGTYCPNHNPCDELKTCIENEIDWAAANNRSAYGAYLKDAPAINITESADECGRTREYFGHEDGFINDLQVCEDIEQLRHSRDFAFIDEFFGQGSDKEEEEEGDGDCSCPTPAVTSAPTEAPITAAPTLPLFEELVLSEPDRTRSTAGPVLNSDAWRAVNFVLRQTCTFVLGNLEAVQHLACPNDMFGVSQTVCALFKNLAVIVLRIIYATMEQIVDISEHTHSEVATVQAQDHFESIENVEVLVNHNLQEIGDYLRESFNMLGSAINFMINDDRTVKCSSRRNLLTELPEIGLQVQIANRKPRAFLCLTSLGGSQLSPVRVDLTVFDWSTKDDVEVSNFGKKDLSPGRLLVEIPESCDGELFTVTVTFQDAESTEMVSKSQLISFQSCDQEARAEPA